MAELILGTVQLGNNYGINNKTGKPNKSEAFKILELAHQNKVLFLDTAIAYGESNKLIGDFSKEAKQNFKILSKIKRDEVKKSVREEVEKHLFTLNCTKLDCLSLHRVDEVEDENFFEQILKLKEEKIISKVGISVYNLTELAGLDEVEKIDVIQLPSNLLDNLENKTIKLKELKKAGKEIHIRSVLLQGLLLMDPENLPEGLSEAKPYLEKLSEICGRFNKPIYDAALAYIFQSDLVDGILVGVDTEEQMKILLNSLNIEISKELVSSIEQLKRPPENIINPSRWQL